MLELVEASLNEIAVLIGLEIIRDLPSSRRIAGNDGFCAHFSDEVPEVVGIVGFVGQHPLWCEPLEQAGGDRCITALARGEDRLERTARPSTAMWIFVVSPPRERPRSIENRKSETVQN